MRPLFYDYPADEHAWVVEDQFMFGPDILVAPVTSEGARARSVYLPAGAKWMDAWTDRPCDGGQRVECDAPISRIPVFVREGSGVRLRG